MTDADLYNSEDFPIAGELYEMTQRIQQQRMGPYEAHVELMSRLDNLNLLHALDYGSTSITTGGHARISSKAMHEVVAGNTRTSRLISVMLKNKGDILPIYYMLATDLGNVGWNQAQYMMFWSLNIAATNARALAGRSYGVFEKRIESGLREDGVDVKVMADATILREKRSEEYVKFVLSIAKTVKSGRISPQPIHRLIGLVDTNISIGCDAERVLAKEMKVPCYRLISMKPTVITDATASIAALREDIRILTAQGAQIAVAKKGASLTIIADL